MRGITGYGVYVPFWRLDRSAIGATLGQGGGKGTRSVASYDEDTTSMGVEAARAALRAVGGAGDAAGLWFATTTPAYLDKTNATAVHAALDLARSVRAFDCVGSVRSGVAAAAAAAGSGGTQLAVLSDIRTGLPGGADEANGGDAAVAFVYGDGSPDDGVIAHVIGSASATGEFLDRWRLPGDAASKQWEERFGEHSYVPLALEAWAAALKDADVTADAVDHVVLAGLHTRAVKAVGGRLGVRREALADDLSAVMGNPGAAQWGVVLADVLDRAEPGQTIAVVVLADGCDVTILRTTAALAAYRSRAAVGVREQLARTRADLPYARFLTWRGFLDREPPRRPEPDRAAAPPSARATRWKYGFVASRDHNGFVHLPPERVSMQGHVVDAMTDVAMADVRATVATFTVDRLAYSMSPPVVAAVIDFDGGGRFQCELTDVDPASVAIGDRVEMTFRRLFTSQGIHNYFWKARPVRYAQGA
jgi:hydroxymethylglutaryl-CoA synthase